MEIKKDSDSSIKKANDMSVGKVDIHIKKQDYFRKGEETQLNDYHKRKTNSSQGKHNDSKNRDSNTEQNQYTAAKSEAAQKHNAIEKKKSKILTARDYARLGERVNSKSEANESDDVETLENSERLAVEQSGKVIGKTVKSSAVFLNRKRKEASTSRFVKKHGFFKNKRQERVFNGMSLKKRDNLRHYMERERESKDSQYTKAYETAQKQKTLNAMYQERKRRFTRRKVEDYEHRRRYYRRIKWIIQKTLSKLGAALKAAFLFGSASTMLAPLLILVVIVLIVSSPFAIFVPGNGDQKSAANIVQEMQMEFNAKISSELERLDGADTSRQAYPEAEGDVWRNNVADVLAVYAVKYGIASPDFNQMSYRHDSSMIMDRVTRPVLMAAGMGNENPMIMTESSIEKLRAVFDEMNRYDTAFVKEEVTENDQTVWKNIKEVRVTALSYSTMAQRYGFNEEQVSMIEEMMTPQNLVAFSGGGSGVSGGLLSPGEWEQINTNLKPGEIGSEAVRLGLTKLGVPYSQAKRFSNGAYYDCSSFCYTMYKQLGIDISYGGATTAAAIGQWGVTNNRVISKDMLAPGDLIFWSGWSNGRFKNITHIAIYAGDGMIVESSSGKGMVVYRKMWGANQHVLYVRPYGV